MEITLSASVNKIGAGAFDGLSCAKQIVFQSGNVPEIGMIALDTLSGDLCIRVPDSQSDGDRIYKAYLSVFAGMFGQSRAYEILDSVSDGAKERNVPAERSVLTEPNAGAPDDKAGEPGTAEDEPEEEITEPEEADEKSDEAEESGKTDIEDVTVMVSEQLLDMKKDSEVAAE